MRLAANYLLALKAKFAKRKSGLQGKNGNLDGRLLRILLILNVFLGHPFAITLLNVKRRCCLYSLCWALFIISNLTLLVYTHIIVLHTVQTFLMEHIGISSLLFVVAGSLGPILAFVRTLSTIAKHSEIVSLFKFIKKSDQVDIDITFKAAAICLISFIMLMNIFIIFSVFSVYIAFQLKDVLFDQSTGQYNVNATIHDKTLQYMKNFSTYEDIVMNSTSKQFINYILMAYSLGMVVMAKLTICDINNHFLYIVAVKMLHQCQRKVSKTLDSGNIAEIERWLYQYHSCMRFLQKTINVTAPSVIATVVFGTFQACLTDYIVVMGLIETSHAVVLFFFGIFALMQIFIYCYFGHKIRLMISEIHVAAYRAHWMRQPKQIQNAISMIANATNGPYSAPHIGAPFFNLSIEFFISIVGVTITYFLVLVQMK